MATIHQVATAANVSVATVSRVVSQPNLVKASTRARVLQVIEALAYEPNRAAQTLRTFKASKILVTVPDISNPFFAKIIKGAEEAARAAGYAVVLGDTGYDPLLEDQYAAMLRRGEVDGLIFLGHRLPEILRADAASGKYPVVNGCEFSPSLPVSSVHIDNRKASSEVIAYLHSVGHSAIGIVSGPPSGPLCQDRLSGAMEVAEAKGMTIEVCDGDFSVETGFRATSDLLSRNCTAIFCFSDEMAIGALSAIKAKGLNCPADVSVVGFDDIRFARYISPSLTTVRQPTDEIGRQTVQILLETIRGERAKPLSLTLPHELILRESTARRRH